MKKNIIFLFILFLLISLSKCEEEEMDYEEEEYEEDYDENEYGYFKSTLKEYLLQNNLLDSDRVIEPEEMKKIFLDVVADGGGPEDNSNFRKIFERLAEHFVEMYYNEKKQIRGKDIYDLINISDVYNKFSDFLGEAPLFNKYDEEEDDLDNIDTMGDL